MYNVIMLQQTQLPEKFLERLARLFSREEMKLTLNAFATKTLPAFRANTLKITAPELEQTLQDQGFLIEHLPWFSDAFLLKNKSVRELTETTSYKNGHLYPESVQHAPCFGS